MEMELIDLIIFCQLCKNDKEFDNEPQHIRIDRIRFTIARFLTKWWYFVFQLNVANINIAMSNYSHYTISCWVEQTKVSTIMMYTCVVYFNHSPVSMVMWLMIVVVALFFFFFTIHSCLCVVAAVSLINFMQKVLQCCLEMS